MSTSTMQHGITFKKLHPVLGGEVSGLDLKQPLTTEQVNHINQLWAKANGILIFKKQYLNEQELKNYSRYFGHVLKHPFIEGDTNDMKHSDTEMMTIGTKARNDLWHSDMTWMRFPPKATFLQCADRDDGDFGDTMFCSLSNTYNKLSPGLQSILEKMTCMHGVQDLMSRYDEKTMGDKLYPNGLGAMSKIENEHPAVIIHPNTGKKSLYVNNWPCKRFAGMSQSETAPLKQYLMDLAIQPDNVYRHKWDIGDLVMIDQRCTMHYAFHDYDDTKQKRIMQRTTLTDAGDSPGKYIYTNF